MRDEQESVAIVDAPGRAVQAIGILKARSLEGHRRAVRSLALAFDRYPAVHRRSRRLDIERCFEGEVVQPVEDLLVLLRADHLLHLGAPGGYQEKYRPLH